MWERKTAILIVIVFFLASLYSAYIVLTLTTQRVYSSPSYYTANINNSTRGGDYFEYFHGHSGPVFLGPDIGATNVSLDTYIYVFQTRRVDVDLQVNPKIPMYKTKEEVSGFYGSITYYPAELLQPNTIYNVSGSIMKKSAWWTFKTASSVTPQQGYEYILSPYTWWIAITAASIATIIFAKIIWRPKSRNKLIQNDQK